MTQRTDADLDAEPITAPAQLTRVFEEGCKPASAWRIGTEHEKFVYRRADHRAPSYEEPGGIRDLLAHMERYGWAPVRENGNVIAMSGPDGGISLEPAGQFELSGAPLENLHETCAEAGRHLKQCKEAGDALGLGFLGMGFWPDKARADLPVMPKGRYAIMRRMMPLVGDLGLDMMLRTCTIQVNLDYASEADMVMKFRVALALQPLATALFAASPFTEGKPNGYLSYRSHIWTDTDPRRTGMLPFVFEDGFGFERYAQYILNVPMYFVYRDGKYIDAGGQDFRDFMDGQAARLSGRAPAHGRLEGSSLHRLPRSPPQILPRDARRRRRPVEPHLRAARAVGRPALRRRRCACRRVGSGETLDDRGSRPHPRRSAAPWRSKRRAHAAAHCSNWPSRCSHLRTGALPSARV